MSDSYRPRDRYYTGFREFDELTGRVTATYTHEWRDRNGDLIRTTQTVIDIGRPDNTTPVDGDAQLADEPWDSERDDNKARLKRIRGKEARHEATVELIRELLQREGEMSARQMKESLGLSHWTLNKIMRDAPDVFIFYPDGPKSVWGLVER